jgi:septation ring formation regulator EzrA
MLDDISTKLDNIIQNDSSNSSTITSSLDNIKKDIENLKDTDTSIFERLDTIDSQVNQVGEYLEAHEEFA